ncbi:MAG: ATP-dependent helicase, partial [Syntrophomonadaceae bacterium]|nr:ATP-dependent helicase [Syntrophomonadaceae bacterium]
IDLTESQFSSPSAVVNKLAALRDLLNKYRSLMMSEPPGSLLFRWIEEHKPKIKRPESLYRLQRVASRFNDLPSFLAQLVLGQEVDHERPGSSVQTAEAVTLMTLHAAKGLEFPVVFITGVEKGLLPLKEWRTQAKQDKLGSNNKVEQQETAPCQEEQSKEGLAHNQDQGQDKNRGQKGRAEIKQVMTLAEEALGEEALAEERRLFYVGLTRAKDKLILVTAKNRNWSGKKASTQPSPFLREIPSDCLEHKDWGTQTWRKSDGSEKIEQLSLF